MLIKAVLFDLDNTHYDRDDTFLRWAQLFVRERLGLRDDVPAAGVSAELVRMDASGYCPRQELFQRIKDQYPLLVETVEELVASFYREHVSHLALAAAEALRERTGTAIRPVAGQALQDRHVAVASAALRATAFAAGDDQAATWVADQAHLLKHGDPTLVLLALLDLPVRAAPQPKAAALARRRALRYLAARGDAIQYAQFLAAGCPIGDGAIESANKRIPEARRKGSGMRWERANVNPMLARRPQRRPQRRRAAAPPPGVPTPVILPPRPPALTPPAPRPRRTTAIPALPPERATRPHPWSSQARLNARSLPDPRANF